MAHPPSMSHAKLHVHTRHYTILTDSSCRCKSAKNVHSPQRLFPLPSLLLPFHFYFYFYIYLILYSPREIDGLSRVVWTRRSHSASRQSYAERYTRETCRSVLPDPEREDCKLEIGCSICILYVALFVRVCVRANAPVLPVRPRDIPPNLRALLLALSFTQNFPLEWTRTHSEWYWNTEFDPPSYRIIFSFYIFFF